MLVKFKLKNYKLEMLCCIFLYAAVCSERKEVEKSYVYGNVNSHYKKTAV